MSAAETFRSLFDEAGHYRAGEGEVPVTFATLGGSRYPGKLHFRGGLCIRAEMSRGGDWAMPDASPLDGLRFLLDFGGVPLRVSVENGKLTPQRDPANAVRKTRFLANLRLARGLFAHPPIAAAEDEQSLLRAAIWLTPRSVHDFDVADFPELGSARQREVQEAAQTFLRVANAVPAQGLPTMEQYREGGRALERLVALLASYLPIPDESKQVEAALRSVSFPDWVVNWDYELRDNYSDEPAIYLTLYAAERPSVQAVAKTTSACFPVVRSNLKKHGIDRWPYINVRDASEHKAG